ncbi:MAG: AcrR family transcriptional regulator [Vicingaceae bacterium]
MRKIVSRIILDVLETKNTKNVSNLKIVSIFATSIMEEKQLFEKVSQLFMRYGIKSMTMDEVARQLGISKKTLYQFVDNKKDLVKKMMEFHIDGEQCSLEATFSKCDNAIDEIMEMTKEVGSQMKEMHPSVMFDMRKYHPEAFQILVNHKDEFVRKCIHNNLENGIKEGFYRTNLNPEIVTELYLSMMSSIMNPENTPSKDINVHEVHGEMMRYHIRGIASSKGREYLKQKFREENV